MKFLFAFACLLLACNHYQALAVTENPLTANDSLMRVYVLQSRFDIAPNADAIILYEKGTADFRNYKHEKVGIDEYKMSYKVEKLIKVIKNNALQTADINLPYSGGISLKDLTATAYNLEEGKLVKKTLNKSKLLKERLDDDMDQYKINLSDVRPGTVIHYTFTYTFDFGYYRRVRDYFGLDWYFQHEFPTLCSEFEVQISPDQLYKDLILVPQRHSFTNRYSQEDFQRSEEGQYSSVTQISRVSEYQNLAIKQWKRSNILPLKDESFVLNEDDLKEKLKLVMVMDDNRARPTLPNSWDSANYSYYYANLGHSLLAFTPAGKADPLLDSVMGKTKDQYELTRLIFKYFRDSISHNRYAQTFTDYVRPKDKTGKKDNRNSGYNLHLTQILRRAGLNAFPVLLSTTDNGLIGKDRFEPQAINYVVCLVNIGGKDYLLDASTPYRPFGVLPSKCYNGFAWLVSEKGMALHIPQEDIINKSICMAALNPAVAPGTYNLTIDYKLGDVAGPAMRAAIDKDTSAPRKELMQHLLDKKYQAELKKLTVINKDNADTALIIRYELELKLDTSEAVTYLNPFFRNLYERNPFIETERQHAVEFGHLFYYQFILKFQLPKGYRPEDYENPVTLKLNGGDILYQNVMQFDPEKNIFSMNNVLASRKATIAAKDYNQLRSMFDGIITEQNKKIVIRKTP